MSDHQKDISEIEDQDWESLDPETLRLLEEGIESAKNGIRFTQEEVMANARARYKAWKEATKNNQSA